MSSIPQSHFPIIAAFFGPESLPTAARGVEPLLGLSPAPAGSSHAPAAIFAALDARLAQLEAHPRGVTPEAGVVRLCLQAAAMQLLAPTAPKSSEAPPPDSATVSNHAPAPATTVASPPPAPPPHAPPRSPQPFAVEAIATPTPPQPQPRPPTTPQPPRAPSVPPPIPMAATSVAPIALAPQSVAPAAPRPALFAGPLAHEAARLVGIHGGITPEVVRGVAMLAAARGLPAASVEPILAGLAEGTRGAAIGAPALRAPVRADAMPAPARTPSLPGTPTDAPSAPAPSLFAPDPSEPDPGAQLVKTAVIVAGAILIASIALIVGGALLISNVPADETTANETVAGDATARAAAPEAAPSRTIEDPLLTIPDAAAVVRAVRTAADQSRADRPLALKTLEQAIPAFAAWWPRMDTGQRAASMSHLVDAALRLAPDPTLADAFIDLVSAPSRVLSTAAGNPPLRADDIAPAAWSVGALVRLSGEQNLPAVVRLRLQAAASIALSGARVGSGGGPSGPSFQAGVSIALRRMPMRILGDGRGADPARSLAAIARWQQTVRQAHGASAAEQASTEAVLVEGLERILVSAPEPDESRVVYDAVTSIAGGGTTGTGLRWRAGDPSRVRLVAWFDDRRISTADLAAVTSAIVTRSGAEGVDSTMVLPPSATGEVRLQLRDAYAAAWNLPSRSASGMSESWLRVAREELMIPPETDGVESLQAVALFARLNEAAWRRHRGDAQGAADIIANDIARLRRANRPPVMPVFIVPKGAAGPDGAWTLRYLSNDRGLPSRLERLRELERSAPFIGPIDADTLAEVAMIGGGELRTTALRMVPAFGSSPHLVNSVLKFLPRAGRSVPLTKALTDLSGRGLGAWNGERFALMARRALVEKALELLAADGPTRAVDLAAAQIADAYEGMAGERSEGGVGEDESGVRAAAAAATLAQSLLDQAARSLPHEHAPIPLDVVRARREARQAVARGLVQRFAADQLTVAEALAILISTERPSRADETRAVLNDLLARHRESPSAQRQLLVAESGILQLWMIRFGESAPAGIAPMPAPPAAPASPAAPPEAVQ